MIRKKLYYFIMLCFLCVFISSISVFATEKLEYTIDDDYFSETYTYIIKSDNTVEIIDYEGDAVSINIPEKINEMDVTSIADYAMSFNTSAYSLNIPKTVSYIGENFAIDFENLETITVDDNNQYYSTKAGALYDKAKTTLIRVPMNKKAIIIDANVENILEDAFYSCNSLNSVDIPANVNNIEEGAFSFCRNLSKITVDEANTSFVAIDGSLYDIGVTTLKRFSAEYDVFELPSTVNRIEGYACSGIEDLEIESNIVIIPYHVAYIGKYAFWGCDNVETLVILNKECEIIEDLEHDEEGLAHLSYASKILGHVGSTAHEYAELFNLEFEEYICEHIYGCIEIEATCVSDGNIKKVCSLCGNEENIIINKLEHIGGDATCCKKAVCTRCDNEYGELSLNDHVNTEIRNKKDATCTENGYTGDICCVDCETKTATGIKVEKKAHTWDAGAVTKEATALEKGEKTYTCTVCKTTKVEEIAALGAPAVGTVVTDDNKTTYKVTKSDLEEGTVTYVAPADRKATNVTIPATVRIDGVEYSVTAIEKNAFDGCKKLKNITMTAGKLKTIGKNAFKGINKKATFKIKGTKKAKTTLKKKLKSKKVGYVKTWRIG